MKFSTVDGIPFRSKETSWLAFNSRVLQQAADDSLPPLERLKFLGIYSSNLDEYFRVRMATLRRLIADERDFRKLHIPDPAETFREASAIIKSQAAVFDRICADIMLALDRAGVRLIDETKVPSQQRDWLLDFFVMQVKPRIMPVMVRGYSQLHNLADSPLYLAVEMHKSGSKGHAGYALLAIPAAELGRFVTLPLHKGRRLVMYLDDVIRFGLHRLFKGLPYDAFKAYAIKFTRDAELEVEENFDESTYEKIAGGLRARSAGQAVRMSYDSKLPKPFLKLLTTKLELGAGDTLMAGARYHNRRDFVKFPGPRELGLAPEQNVPHRALSGGDNFFRILQERDVLLHYPWHSFRHFLDFLRMASLDPLVTSIHMTQYRVARHSCVARALIHAAHNGKEVTVLVEPQARFDEQNNIDYARMYQDAGARVILGVPGLKVHAKLCLVTRQESGVLRHYSALSTGNFNEETASFYTDHMLFTAHPGIGADVAECFRFFATTWDPPRLSHLVAAPFNLRAAIRFYIQTEIANALQKRPASIFLKLNNLADPEITGLLYAAEKAGVKVRLIVRSMFSVVTGSAPRTMRAISIVDRYLEHSRIFIFANGSQQRVLLSSADFLPRNFDKRFETAIPVLDPLLQKELVHVLETQWQDTSSARELDRNLNNKPAAGKRGGRRSQVEIREWLEKESD